MALTQFTDIDDELEVIFIAETFHKSEPIRAKPLQLTIPRVWLKDKPKKIKDCNGITIKQEPQPRTPINLRFAELIVIRQQSGVIFESDVMDDEDYADDDDDDDFQDIDDPTNEELVLGSAKGLKKSTKKSIAMNLAKKLKKRAIANRLGVAYNAANSTKLRNLRSRLGTTKSWSEKFGQLLAAKKLLYLPLLYRKYKMGPNKTREELDIEIDLYMAEVRRAKKLKLGFDQITEAANNTDDNNNGLKVINPKEMFGGFGGPGWKKRLITAPETKEEKPDRDQLDMEIDQYMAQKM